MPYTITAAAQWPEILKRERSLSWIPEFGNERGPPGLDGTSQYRNINGGGLWRCVMSSVQLRQASHVREWLALEIALRGGKTPIDVPLLLCQDLPNGTTIDGAWAARSVAGRIFNDNAADIKIGMHFSLVDPVTYGWRMHRIESVVTVTTNKRDLTFWPPTRFNVASLDPVYFNLPRCVMRLVASNSMDLDLELRKRGNPNAEFIEAY